MGGFGLLRWPRRAGESTLSTACFVRIFAALFSFQLVESCLCDTACSLQNDDRFLLLVVYNSSLRAGTPSANATKSNTFHRYSMDTVTLWYIMLPLLVFWISLDHG